MALRDRGVRVSKRGTPISLIMSPASTPGCGWLSLHRTPSRAGPSELQLSLRGKALSLRGLTWSSLQLVRSYLSMGSLWSSSPVEIGRG